MVSSSITYCNVSCGRLLLNQPLFRVTAGAAVHALCQGLYQETGYGIGSDLGLSASLPREGLKASLLFENATTTYIRWSADYSEEALPHLRLALGWQKAVDYLYGRLQPSYSSLDFLVNDGINSAVQGDQGADTVAQPQVIHPSVDPVGFILGGNWGAEYVVMERLALRLGYGAPGRFTFGAGILAWHRKLGLDFALLTHPDLPQTYCASIRYAW